MRSSEGTKREAKSSLFCIVGGAAERAVQSHGQDIKKECAYLISEASLEALALAEECMHLHATNMSATTVHRPDAWIPFLQANV